MLMSLIQDNHLVKENGQWKIENDWFNLNDMFAVALKAGNSSSPTSSEPVNDDLVFPGDALTYMSSKEIAGQNLFITEDLKELYVNYSKSKSDELLKGLNPIDVLRLFNQACEDNNIEMQVSLYELPADVSRNQFMQEIENDQTSKEVEKQLLQRLHEFKGKIIERVVNDKKAYIVIEKNGWYRMEKDKNGIWKLGWMARA